MTREESLQILHSVYEDIKNMTEEDIEDFNNTVREYKKEQQVNREEALQFLENRSNDWSMGIKRIELYDEELNDLVAALKQPLTLAEFLGWEEKEEYEWRGDTFRVQSDILQVWDKEDEMWFDSSEELNDYLRLRQAKKVEPKLIAWYVRDEYSFKELQKELESKGIHKYKGQEYLPDDFFKDGNSIYVFVENETWHTSNWYNVPEGRYLIPYHKEKPKYLLQTDLTSENGIQYLSFDKKRRKYFIGALIASDNVQQKFTDDEITKIKLTTRFAKLCKKIEVE